MHIEVTAEMREAVRRVYYESERIGATRGHRALCQVTPSYFAKTVESQSILANLVIAAIEKEEATA